MERRTTVDIAGESYDASFAQISEAFIGFEDHGIFTAYLSFTGQGWAQSEPARGWTATQLQRYLKAVLTTLGVQSWDQVAKQEVLVLRKSPLGLIEGFAHRSEDRYLIFASIAEEAA